MDLHGEDQAQGVLFAVSAPARPVLMDVIDRANARWGRGTLKVAAEGVRKPWQMKRERVSPAYTTRWDELPRVN